MKKMKFSVFTVLLLSIAVLSACGSSKSTSKKYSRADEMNEKIEQYTTQGWQIHGSTRTLRGKLTEHYDKLEANENLYELIGTSTGCRSITVCRAAALNAACVDAATKLGQELKGKTMRDMGLDEGAAVSTEYNKFQSACISKFQASIKGNMTESLALIHKEGDVNSYEIYFLVDKEAERKKRIQAIEDALAENKLNQEYARSVESFINEENGANE